jgi:hypothetical protein
LRGHLQCPFATPGNLTGPFLAKRLPGARRQKRNHSEPAFLRSSLRGAAKTPGPQAFDSRPPSAERSGGGCRENAFVEISKRYSNRNFRFLVDAWAFASEPPRTPAGQRVSHWRARKTPNAGISSELCSFLASNSSKAAPLNVTVFGSLVKFKRKQNRSVSLDRTVA